MEYAAGLMDGEGTFTLMSRGKGQYRTPIAEMTSTTYELIEFMRKLFGGTIRKQKVYKAHYKQSWAWHVSFDAAISCMEQLEPLMLEPKKKARARHIIQNFKAVTVRNGRYTDEEKKAKLDFEEAFFALT